MTRTLLLYNLKLNFLIFYQFKQLSDYINYIEFGVDRKPVYDSY